MPKSMTMTVSVIRYFYFWYYNILVGHRYFRNFRKFYFVIESIITSLWDYCSALYAGLDKFLHCQYAEKICMLAIQTIQNAAAHLLKATEKL